VKESGGLAQMAQKGRMFRADAARIAVYCFQEATMFELLKSLAFAVIMVPVVMAVILGLIWGLGEVFNIFSGIGHKDQSKQHR